MTDEDFIKFIEHLQGLFVAKDAMSDVQLSRWKFMLADLDGQGVTYREGMYALREIAADGQKFVPVPGEVLAKVRASRSDGGVEVVDERTARSRFAGQFRATALAYGREFAIAFHDPHGEFKDWRPQTGQLGGPTHPGGIEQLKKLGALALLERGLTQKKRCSSCHFRQERMA
jgi:hypothetical protein